MQRTQRGSALVTGLVFLVVIIMLGLSASSGSIQQELGVRSVRDQNIALMASEAAMRAAEAWLGTNNGPFPITIEPINGKSQIRPIGFCDRTANNCAEAGAAFWLANGEELGGGAADNTPALKLVAEQPRFIIELYYICPDCEGFGTPLTSRTHYYRITARGVGMNEKTDRVVQSIYRY